MWQSLVVCSCVIIALNSLPTSAWMWKCINRRCVRSASPLEVTPAHSLEVCRLTCNQYGALWPQPTGHTAISDKVVAFDPSGVSFDFSAVSEFSRHPVKELVTAMSRVFVDNLVRMCHSNCSVVPESLVTVYLATTSADLNLRLTDESYAVDIITRGNRVTVHIQADTVFGARHGLETLSQLIAYTKSNNQLVIVTTAKVSDKPVYSHRGLLLDTARNYLPVSALKRSIDAMAASKLNVLHWHATDSHSFPLVLPRVPELSRFGAYSAAEVYTPGDINDLINYARVRGVSILLELDMPAHAGNGWQWGPGAGQGSLAVCVNQQPWRQSCLQPPCGQLNPANPNLFRVLRSVFKDIIDRLPQGEEAFHMGGDEVYFPCWNQTSEITDWMKSRGMGLSQTDFLNVWGEFQKKVLQVWDEEIGNLKTPIFLWTSHLTDADIIEQYLDKDRYVIEAWTDASDPLAFRLLDMGYQVIMATKDAWYLDHGFWGRTQYHNWRRAYDNRLPKKRGVRGGEVAMWGELVDDNNLDSRVWPRATAAAERLWSDPDTDNSVAEYRLLEQRQRLIQRGLKPEAIAPEWCVQNEDSCLGSSNTS